MKFAQRSRELPARTPARALGVCWESTLLHEMSCARIDMSSRSLASSRGARLRSLQFADEALPASTYAERISFEEEVTSERLPHSARRRMQRMTQLPRGASRRQLSRACNDRGSPANGCRWAFVAERLARITVQAACGGLAPPMYTQTQL
jgi:hypothetical protein